MDGFHLFREVKSGRLCLQLEESGSQSGRMTEGEVGTCRNITLAPRHQFEGRVHIRTDKTTEMAMVMATAMAMAEEENRSITVHFQPCLRAMLLLHSV